jgi:hypothetical protein
MTKISDFTPDPNNLNKGSERGNYALERSLRDYGFARPVVADKDGVILAGNHAYQKAGEIGLKNVRVIETDGTEIIVHKRIDLDASTAKARMVALSDNRTSELNYDLDDVELNKIAVDLPELSNFFNESEMARFQDATVINALEDLAKDFPSTQPGVQQSVKPGEEDEENEWSEEQEFYGFSCPVTYEQRQLIFEAINKAKALSKTTSTANALERICQTFLDNQ